MIISEKHILVILCSAYPSLASYLDLEENKVVEFSTCEVITHGSSCHYNRQTRGAGKEIILLEWFWHITSNKRMRSDSDYAFCTEIAQKLCVLIASY